MDRKAWIVITLCAAGLIFWSVQTAKMAARRPAPAATQALPTASPASTAPQSQPTQPAVAAPAVPATVEPRTEIVPANGSEYIFNNDAGGIESVQLLLHQGESAQNVTLNRDRALPVGALGLAPGEVLGGFEMSRESGEVVFTRTIPHSGLEITKRFVVPQTDSKEDLYLTSMEVTFRNPGEKVVQVPSYFISAGGAAPIHSQDLPMYTKFDWFHEGKFTNIDVNWFSASTIPLLGIEWKAAQPLYVQEKPDVTWAAVSSQYFCSIVTAKDVKGTSVWSRRFDSRKVDNKQIHGVQGAIGLPGFALEGGQSITQKFQIYTGPKELGRLRKLGGGQEAILNFGMFGIVSEFLLWAMNSLNGVFHSYAAAIIVLTLLIKTALWPVQNKATKEMRKMSALSPKMTEMREKYKDDPTRMNEEVMKLYREYGVNPFSGCLPMFIQIPIFFGFYAMLGTAIELRNSSFLWIHDLSQPDTLFRLPLTGWPVNLLPILMAGSMVWQMKITPKSGDAMQQRILYFMPIIFLVFCYNYASGLALYWTTQNIFSIVQLYMTRNIPLPTLEKKSDVAKREAAATKKKQKKRSVT